MFDAARFRSLMADRDISQSELARRVGVAQTTIAKLASGRGYGSKHIHRIARELRTTPAYLTGEIDDPDEGAPPPPPVARHQEVKLSVMLPSEAALAAAFRGVLLASEDMDLDELAGELARRLPIVLRLSASAATLPTSAPSDTSLAPDELPVPAHRERRRA